MKIFCDAVTGDVHVASVGGDGEKGQDGGNGAQGRDGARVKNISFVHLFRIC